MSKTLKTSLFLLLFFLCAFSGFSQNQKRPLTEVLSLIEAKHNVSFSYADKDVKHILIDVSTEKSLDSILDEISLKTNLQFNKIDQQYYTIVKQTESDSFSLQFQGKI